MEQSYWWQKLRYMYSFGKLEIFSEHDTITMNQMCLDSFSSSLFFFLPQAKEVLSVHNGVPV